MFVRNAMTDLNEAEIQVLASLQQADDESLPADRASLEKGGERYWIYREDWSDAFSILIAKGLIEGNDSGYRLTDTGRPLGRAYYDERPEWMYYHYQRFWKPAYESAAHSRHCERVFGKDLCQDGMVDMAALQDLLARLDLKADQHLLDLGCGAGVITEYISDLTGARLTGLDYAQAAINMAHERTATKRNRLTFVRGDLNSLDLPAQSFDAAISLDTLYWAADLVDTMSRVVRAIKSGGQIGIFMMQGPWDDDPPGTVPAEETELGKALSKLNLRYEAYDYTARNVEFWQRHWQSSVDLRGEYEAEGNGFIAESLIKEAEEDVLPAIKAEKMTRYLYHVRL
jgi:ubiquinone/menaquinone biosynthesis C-methylase UbiE